MPIERHRPGAFFPRALVWLVVGLLGPGFGRTAAPEVPAALAAALANFRGDVPPRWSYTLSTTAEGKSTVELCDAAKPEFARWSLVRKDGRPPTTGETQEYLEGRSRRSRGGTAPKLTEQLDLASVEEIARDETATTFRCRIRPGEARDKIAGFLRAAIIVHRATHTIQTIELHSIGPFNPTFGVSIAEMKTRMTYSLPSTATPSLPQKVETRMRGTAFWFKSIDADMTVVFGDYSHVGKR